MTPQKPNPNHGSTLLTSREVVQLYRVNPETVRRWVRKGIRPWSVSGGRPDSLLRVPGSALLR